MLNDLVDTLERRNDASQTTGRLTITPILGADDPCPDWVLLDLHLPDISGEEVLRRLRQNPKTQHIPITVLSADATPGQISRLLASGSREYLTKPFDVNQLLRLLEATLPHMNAVVDPEPANARRNRSE